jgi:hypothetical protein
VSTSLQRCTVLGRVATGSFAEGAHSTPESFGVAIDEGERLATSDTLFVGRTAPAVEAEHRQVGCIRFSYVPGQSLTPRLYRCVSTPEPQFASADYASPSYMLLARSTPDAIARSAENGGEIGVYNRAAHQARGDNIRRSIEDFLRFGHSSGLFHET